MITIDSILSKKNIATAFEHFSIKKNGGGTDRSDPTELKTYWEQNGERIKEQIRSCTYNPGVIAEYEIINGKGKRRVVTKFNDVDRLITRLLSQKLSRFYNPTFLNNSCAYQDNKGVVTATDLARNYIEEGNEFVVEIDIEHFFDEIDLEMLYALLENRIKDIAVLHLLKEYLYCIVSNDGVTRQISKGILQGSSMSPVLSNLYLHSFDEYLENKGLNWVRFADDINIYVDSEEAGEQVYSEVCQVLIKKYKLPINQQKSGVFDAYERRYLGYDFHRRGKHVIVSRHSYQKQGYYREWHPCVVEKVNREYHITKGGILNKKDYALIFENTDEKHHIPVEATEQLDLYNDVTITNSVIRTLSYENVRLGIYDRFGDLLGYYIPEGYSADSKILLMQCMEYSDKASRLKTAKAMEIAAIHNIRANIRYYGKKKQNELTDTESYLSQGIKEMNECKDVEGLLLVEARCRQQYYRAFNIILGNKDFYFDKRTKQPPMDPINALISFGNTVLYNRIQQKIWKTSLDSRIGVFHAAGKRNHSLNLDFADMFKPLTVDRTIFTLINRGQIRISDFVNHEGGGIYLNDSGKRLFIECFEEKMSSKLTVKDRPMTYDQLIEREIYNYIEHIKTGAKYAPYKYY